LLENSFPFRDSLAIFCMVRFVWFAQKATGPAILGASAFMVRHAVRFSSARVCILQLGYNIPTSPPPPKRRRVSLNGAHARMVYESTPFGYRREEGRLLTDAREQEALAEMQRMDVAGASYGNAGMNGHR
jgi:hypothetical protein